MPDFHKPRIPFAVVPTPLGAWDVGHIARTIEREITSNTKRQLEAAASTSIGSLATEQFYAGRVDALLGVLRHLQEATASPMPDPLGAATPPAPLALTIERKGLEHEFEA